MVKKLNFVKFGRNLRKYRKQANLEQHELADKTGVNRGYISYIETAQKKPSLELAVRLAKAVGCTVDDLVN